MGFSDGLNMGVEGKVNSLIVTFLKDWKFLIYEKSRTWEEKVDGSAYNIMRLITFSR